MRDVPPAANPTSATDDWHEAAQALAGMRIVQQPAPLPAQNGGAYERSLADARPVSPATASAATAAHALDGSRGPLDPVLIACLENPRERLTLLKFEDQIVRFLKNPREPQLVFPPLSSYHRLIIHRLAERCCLEHQTADYGQYAPGAAYDGNAARAVTLFKTGASVVPGVLLIDLSSDRQQQTVTPAVVPKIMVRKRAAPRPGANGGRGPGDAKNAQRSMQDRERAYAEARARIFGEDSSASAADSTSSSSSSSTVSPNSSAAAATTPSASGKGGSGLGAAKMNSTSQQASGPDGSRGFGGGRGRGRGGASPQRPQQQQQQPADQGSEPTRTADASATGEMSSSAATPRVQSAHNWKESKVLWRNREQELNDPDFTRNRDAYRPSRSAAANSSGSDGRYPLPHQAVGARYLPAPPVEYYDAAQQQQQQQPPPPQYGYLQQQQPPLPGRRYPAGGEFNRLDNMRPPPPPPDHFRSGGAGNRFPIGNPPPPLPGAVMASVARGGVYGGGYPSPHSRQYHSSPSPVRSGSAGYNADFPPLGK
ncbi:hypothetical protein PybrP1_001002 [[Pythium] brassicae (nom. inval.)]|nr:hypothetical protein PybrP1_001002 [[Pythium] brassicae (nom. inval.)]